MDTPFPFSKGNLNMNYGEKSDKKKKRIVPKVPVKIIIRREYIGTQTVVEAFIPIIYEDIRKSIKPDSFDRKSLPI